MIVGLTLVAAIAASAPSMSDSAHSAQKDYMGCLTAQAGTLRKAPVSIQQASEIAVGRCRTPRNEYTLELLKSVTGGASVVSVQILDAAVSILDFSEREMLRNVRIKLAADRGVKWEEELHVDYQ